MTHSTQEQFIIDHFIDTIRNDKEKLELLMKDLFLSSRYLLGGQNKNRYATYVFSYVRSTVDNDNNDEQATNIIDINSVVTKKQLSPIQRRNISNSIKNGDVLLLTSAPEYILRENKFLENCAIQMTGFPDNADKSEFNNVLKVISSNTAFSQLLVNLTDEFLSDMVIYAAKNNSFRFDWRNFITKTNELVK